WSDASPWGRLNDFQRHFQPSLMGRASFGPPIPGTKVPGYFQRSPRGPFAKMDFRRGLNLLSGWRSEAQPQEVTVNVRTSGDLLFARNDSAQTRTINCPGHQHGLVCSLLLADLAELALGLPRLGLVPRHGGNLVAVGIDVVRLRCCTRPAAGDLQEGKG